MLALSSIHPLQLELSPKHTPHSSISKLLPFIIPQSSKHVELSPFGISVSIVEPGNFVTEFEKNQIRGKDSESTKFPYRELLQKYRNRRRSFDWAANPDKVARVIEGIIKSSSPKLRYVVGLDARLALFARQILPEKLFFHILRKISLGK